MEDMISTTGGDITVYALVEKYTSQRKSMRHSTKAGYKTILNILAKEDFVRKQIKDVRLSDAKERLIQLQPMERATVPSRRSGVWSDLLSRWRWMMT